MGTLQVNGNISATGTITASSFLGNASSASKLATSINALSGSTHAEALKAYFTANKNTIPRNSLLSYWSSAYANGSQYMGYWSSYNENNNEYGGFYVAHYDTPYYIGISNGIYTQYTLLNSWNYRNYALSLNGGTLTGNLIFSSSNGIATRHIDGENSQFAGELYLNYNRNAAIHVGAGGAYTISADGSFYSGSCSYANSAGNADSVDGQHFHWSGQGGQPSWLWGGNEYGNMYVYNPSNFNVNYANSAGSVAWSGIINKPDFGCEMIDSSDTYFYAHYTRYGKLITCTLMPKLSKTTVIYEVILNIPTGYSPVPNGRTFSFYSNQSIAAGGSGAMGRIYVMNNGTIKLTSAYGLTLEECKGTYCWIRDI